MRQVFECRVLYARTSKGIVPPLSSYMRGTIKGQSIVVMWLMVRARWKRSLYVAR